MSWVVTFIRSTVLPKPPAAAPGAPKGSAVPATASAKASKQIQVSAPRSQDERVDVNGE